MKQLADAYTAILQREGQPEEVARAVFWLATSPPMLQPLIGWLMAAV